MIRVCEVLLVQLYMRCMYMFLNFFVILFLNMCIEYLHPHVRRRNHPTMFQGLEEFEVLVQYCLMVVTNSHNIIIALIAITTLQQADKISKKDATP